MSRQVAHSKIFSRFGSSVIPGDKYIPAAYVPKKVVSLNEVRRRLSKIKENLSDTVRAIREEE